MTDAEIDELAELESLCGEADWQIDYESRQYLALAGTIRALDAIPGLIAALRAARADAARMREALVELATREDISVPWDAQGNRGHVCVLCDGDGPEPGRVRHEAACPLGAARIDAGEPR